MQPTGTGSSRTRAERARQPKSYPTSGLNRVRVIVPEACPFLSGSLWVTEICHDQNSSACSRAGRHVSWRVVGDHLLDDTRSQHAKRAGNELPCPACHSGLHAGGGQTVRTRVAERQLPSHLGLGVRTLFVTTPAPALPSPACSAAALRPPAAPSAPASRTLLTLRSAYRNGDPDQTGSRHRFTIG